MGEKNSGLFVEIDPDLKKDLKVKAAIKGVTMKSLIVEALEEKLKEAVEAANLE